MEIGTIAFAVFAILVLVYFVIGYSHERNPGGPVDKFVDDVGTATGEAVWKAKRSDMIYRASSLGHEPVLKSVRGYAVDPTVHEWAEPERLFSLECLKCGRSSGHIGEGNHLGDLEIPCGEPLPDLDPIEERRKRDEEVLKTCEFEWHGGQTANNPPDRFCSNCHQRERGHNLSPVQRAQLELDDLNWARQWRDVGQVEWGYLQPEAERILLEAGEPITAQTERDGEG